MWKLEKSSACSNRSYLNENKISPVSCETGLIISAGLDVIDFPTRTLVDQFQMREFFNFLWGEIVLVFVRLEPDDIPRLIIRPAGISHGRVGFGDEWQKRNRLARKEPDRIHIVAVKDLLWLLRSDPLHFGDNG